jgi:hypothetical protein
MLKSAHYPQAFADEGEETRSARLRLRFSPALPLPRRRPAKNAV